MSNTIIKREVIIGFSILKPLMKIRLWNILTFEHLERNLIRWLDRDIEKGEKNRRIDRLVSTFNNNEKHHVWKSVKIDNDVCVMMFGPHDIFFIIIIS